MTSFSLSRSFAVAALMGTALVGALLPQRAVAAPQAPKFALLVGITDYSRDGLPKLQGCLNDVRDMRQELIADFGFKPENILTLTNAQATRAGIASAFRAQLHDNAQKNPGGTFLFYYSGHGFQTPDLNGDEKLEDPNDTQDETFMAWDADLIDDDVDELCRETRGVKDFTGSLTVILDSCHSGTATRGALGDGKPNVKSAQATYQPSPETPLRALPIAANPAGGTLTAFSGCLPSQSSEEKLFPVADAPGAKGAPGNDYHGVLTYYLLQSMKAATQSTTNSQIWTQVATVLSGKYDQLPLLEGSRPNLSFLGGANRATVPPIPYTLAGGTLSFPKGIEAGAVKGGFVRVSSAGQTAKPLTISKAQLGRASALVPAGTALAPTGTVELLTPYFGSEPLKIGIGDGIAGDNPLVSHLRAHYSGDAGNFVSLAQTGETPNVYLLRATRGAALPAASETSAQNRDDKGYILSKAPGGQPIFHIFLPATEPGDDISAAGEVRLFETLDNYAAQSNVKALTNQDENGLTPEQAVEITATRINGGFNAKHRWHADNNDLTPRSIDLSQQTLKAGEGIQFEFKNQTSQPLYLAALWLSNDGSITILQDTQQQKQLVLAPAGVAGASALTAKYGIEGESGAETIKLFVSRQPINVDYLERDAVRGARSGAASPFDLLAGQMMGTRAPQPDFDQPEFESWGALTLLVKISNAPQTANAKGFIDPSR